MADVKKCDICGAVYEARTDEWFRGATSSAVRITDYGDYAKDNKGEYIGYDTCPTCTTCIRDYIANMKVQYAIKNALKADEAFRRRRYSCCR